VHLDTNIFFFSKVVYFFLPFIFCNLGFQWCPQASFENSFLMVWVRDFVPNQALGTPEYFVYCGVFKVRSWDKRSSQTAKGGFSEVPKTKTTTDKRQKVQIHG
jgi:hypothetical protein